MHHTLPKCSSEEPVAAMGITAGDCVHTATGRGLVGSVEYVPVKSGGVTYSIEMKDAELVAVGGIFTHAKMVAAPHTSTNKNGAARTAALNKKSSDIKAKISSLQRAQALKVAAMLGSRPETQPLLRKGAKVA